MSRRGNVLLGVIGALLLVSAARAGGVAFALPVRWAWLPGTLLGVFGGTWGGLAGTLAPKGHARKALMGFAVVLLAADVVMLAMGVTLLVWGDGYAAWYPWLLPGAIGVVVFPPLLSTVRMRYQQAEARRLAAMDIVSEEP